MTRQNLKINYLTADKKSDEGALKNGGAGGGDEEAVNQSAANIDEARTEASILRSPHSQDHPHPHHHLVPTILSSLFSKLRIKQKRSSHHEISNTFDLNNESDPSRRKRRESDPVFKSIDRKRGSHKTFWSARTQKERPHLGSYEHKTTLKSEKIDQLWGSAENDLNVASNSNNDDETSIGLSLDNKSNLEENIQPKQHVVSFTMPVVSSSLTSLQQQQEKQQIFSEQPQPQPQPLQQPQQQPQQKRHSQENLDKQVKARHTKTKSLDLRNSIRMSIGRKFNSSSTNRALFFPKSINNLNLRDSPSDINSNLRKLLCDGGAGECSSNVFISIGMPLQLSQVFQAVQNLIIKILIQGEDYLIILFHFNCMFHRTLVSLHSFVDLHTEIVSAKFDFNKYFDVFNVHNARVRVCEEDEAAIRKEILKFSLLLSSSVASKSTELNLSILKQKFPQMFHSICLYSEISSLLGGSKFRLEARRFIQELFADLDFNEVRSLLRHFNIFIIINNINNNNINVINNINGIIKINNNFNNNITINVSGKNINNISKNIFIFININNNNFNNINNINNINTVNIETTPVTISKISHLGSEISQIKLNFDEM
ncbi:hypothetical protein HELRODRAFT_172488 [Helobdella robusta]|uniref:Uncharacterized protein n=1 Tax=Helobdella robusta TaxID=6412 RepID=T1F5E0_HELRO|nr:hypothetical protein HELRODRAFT_172488 [Helobdella robusta]ESO04813.1 hypothetical protein HELRODRAFT_172488 [Helobdella robusta]